MFLSDVGRTFWAAGSRRTGAIEALGVSSKFGPNDSRSRARGSMQLTLWISCWQTSPVRDAEGNSGADGPADVEARGRHRRTCESTRSKMPPLALEPAFGIRRLPCGRDSLGLGVRFLVNWCWCTTGKRKEGPGVVGPLRAPYLSTTSKIDDDETVDAERAPGKGIRRRPRGAADSNKFQ